MGVACVVFIQHPMALRIAPKQFDAPGGQVDEHVFLQAFQLRWRRTCCPLVEGSRGVGEHFDNEQRMVEVFRRPGHVHRR